MKKILLVPAIIGLLVVPSVVIAHASGSNNKPSNTQKNAEHSNGAVQSATTTNDKENDEKDEDNQAAITVPTDSISLDQAKTIALGVFPGKTIKKTETEHEEGTLTYSIRFTDGSRVDVRASDGVVTRTRLKGKENNHSGSSKTSHEADED